MANMSVTPVQTPVQTRERKKQLKKDKTQSKATREAEYLASPEWEALLEKAKELYPIVWESIVTCKYPQRNDTHIIAAIREYASIFLPKWNTLGVSRTPNMRKKFEYVQRVLSHREPNFFSVPNIQKVISFVNDAITHTSKGKPVRFISQTTGLLYSPEVKVVATPVSVPQSLDKISIRVSRTKVFEYPSTRLFNFETLPTELKISNSQGEYVDKWATLKHKGFCARTNCNIASLLFYVKCGTEDEQEHVVYTANELFALLCKHAKHPWIAYEKYVKLRAEEANHYWYIYELHCRVIRMLVTRHSVKFAEHGLYVRECDACGDQHFVKHNTPTSSFLTQSIPTPPCNNPHCRNKIGTCNSCLVPSPHKETNGICPPVIIALMLLNGAMIKQITEAECYKYRNDYVFRESGKLLVWMGLPYDLIRMILNMIPWFNPGFGYNYNETIVKPGCNFLIRPTIQGVFPGNYDEPMFDDIKTYEVNPPHPAITFNNVTGEISGVMPPYGFTCKIECIGPYVNQVIQLSLKTGPSTLIECPICQRINYIDANPEKKHLCKNNRCRYKYCTDCMGPYHGNTCCMPTLPTE